jgi:nucleotide-binding universal stress UspA family protein
VLVAYDLAKKFGSEIHVFNLASFGNNSEFLSGLGAPRSRDEVVLDACEHIQDYVLSVVPGAQRFVTCDVAMGDDLVEAVAAAATKCDATCVVLAIHEHARRALFRTRAEKILRAVACPVLVVKTPD